MQGEYYGNALQAAAASSHEQIVKLLLDRSANVNARGQYYWKWWCELINSNALCVASEEDHEQIVKLLFNKGADANMKGGQYGNTLVAASAGGYKQVIELLLEKDAVLV